MSIKSTAPPAGKELRLTRHEADESPLQIFPGSYEEIDDPPPVCWQSIHGGYWAVLRYQQAREVLADTRHFSSAQNLHQALLSHEAASGVGAIPLNLDTPLHSEYRRLLTPVIASGARRAGRSLARSVVAEVLASAGQGEPEDFNDTFAVPVTAKTIFRFVGFPAEDEDEFVEQTRLFVRSRHMGGGGKQVVLSRIRGLLSQVEQSWMKAYIQHRSTCGLIGLLGAKEWTTHFDSREAEAARMFFDFIQAGLTQLPVALRNEIGHLTAHRDDREALLENPGLAPHLAGELLRLYPLTFPARTVRRDVEVAGVKLYVGEVVLPLVGFANRDATVFGQPHGVLLDRAHPRRHLAFGAGPHYCLGAGLAHDVLSASLASAEEIIRNYQLVAG